MVEGGSVWGRHGARVSVPGPQRWCPQEKQPAIIQKLFHKRIQKGLDLAGGLRLVYNVNVDKAVSTRSTRSPTRVEDNLHKQEHRDVHVAREGRDEIIFTFKNPADLAKLDNDVLAEYRDDARRGRQRTRPRVWSATARSRSGGRDPGLRPAPGHRDHPRPGRQVRRVRAHHHQEGQRHRRRAAGPGAAGLRAHQVHHRPHRPAAVQDRRRAPRSTPRRWRPPSPKDSGITVEPDTWRGREDRRHARGRLPAGQGPGHPREVRGRPDRANWRSRTTGSSATRR